MIFLCCFLIVILSVAMAGFAAGLIAVGGVKWYRISKFEGGSGYFVVFMALLGLIAGLIIGLFVAFSVLPDTGAGFLKGLGIDWGIIWSIAGIVAAISWLLADIPPTIDGEELHLVVDVRWPVDQAVSPADDEGEPYLVLGSVSGHTMRKQQRGVFWQGEAALIDGRWTARGAAHIFTSRGRRTLTIHTANGFAESFLVPVPRFPRRGSLHWSDWLPRTPASKLTYRWRVQRRSEPMKSETFGRFEIVTVVRSIGDASENGRPYLATDDRFRIKLNDNPLPVDRTGDAIPGINFIFTFPGNTRAMLVNVERAYASSQLYLVQDEGGNPRADLIADSVPSLTVIHLGPGKSMQSFARETHRRLLETDGLYLITSGVVFDTRAVKAYRFDRPAGTSEYGDFRPFGLSPDERSFVRVAMLTETGRPILVTTDFVDGQSEILPIDPRRMRFTRVEQIDSIWVNHHFEWTRGPAGFDRLTLRSEFEPLPYRGDLTLEFDGRRMYRVDGFPVSIRNDLDTILVEQFKAESRGEEASFDHVFQLDGAKISTCYIDGSRCGMAWFDAAIKPDRAAEVAAAFDRELATGKYDSDFANP